MQLKSYLRENSLTSQAFADQLSVTRGSIERYKSGDRIPRPHIQVTANDFLENHFIMQEARDGTI